LSGRRLGPARSASAGRATGRCCGTSLKHAGSARCGSQGSSATGLPAGKHDDLVSALALCLFGLRRFGAVHVRRAGARRATPSSAAWT
jgi:hypothetical protein